MKKILIFLMLLHVISSAIFADTRTATIELQGAYGTALNMTITPIAAQTESYLAGMPFNIEEDYVQYMANSDGRVIANWNVLSNDIFKIYIKADNMVYADETPNTPYNPKTPLSYYLTFTYNLAYPTAEAFDGNGSFYLTSGEIMQYGASDNNTIISITDKEYVTSIGNQTASFYEIDLFGDAFGHVQEGAGFTGSVEGRISFKFTNSASKALLGIDTIDTRDQYPAGNYTANVTFFVEAE